VATAELVAAAAAAAVAGGSWNERFTKMFLFLSNCLSEYYRSLIKAPHTSACASTDL